MLNLERVTYMKLKIALSIVFLLPVSIAYADTPVATDSQQVCENRINAFKSALQASIDAKQNVDEAKAELAQINTLPSTLAPCEKQKRIPALSNGEVSKRANEAQKDRKISQ